MVIEDPEIITPRTTNYRAFRELSEADFDPEAVNDFEKAAILACKAAVLGPTSHNKQQFGLRIGDGFVWLMPNIHDPLPGSDPTGRQMYESVGAVGANMKIALRASGWLPETKILSNSRTGITFQEITMTPGYQPTQRDKELAAAIPNRVNYDGNHLAYPLPDELVQELNELKNGFAGIDFNLVRNIDVKKQIGVLIQKSGGIIYRRPFFTGELVANLRDAVTGRKDGLLTSKLGGIPKFIQRYAPRAIVSAAESFIMNVTLADRNKTRMSAGIGVFSSNEDNPAGWMRVGEYLETVILTGVAHGVYSGIRAALIETDLHRDLEKAIGTDKRGQAMIRMGIPEEREIPRGPRFPFEERLAVKMEGEWRVPATDKPTIFKLGEDQDYQDVEQLLKDLGDGFLELNEVDELTYSEHDLPDLFSVLHPEMTDPTSITYLEQLNEFVKARTGDDKGVWVYNPKERTLKKYLEEEDFYAVKTANNSSEISKQGQKNLKNMRIAIAGLSGSGLQAMEAIAMSGAKYLKLADFDFISRRNKGRMKGKVGENKAYEAAWAAWEENPFLEIEIFEEGLTDFNIDDFVKGQDVIVEQMDSAKKFSIREVKARIGKPGSVLLMVTDFPDPIGEIERQGAKPFGGRAEAAGIDKQKMDGIISAAEATGYLPVLMGRKDVPAGGYDNFRRVVEGEENASSQLFVSTLAGGAVAGRVVIAIAEGKVDQLPPHWVARLLPQTEDDIINQAAARERFERSYSQNIGEI